MENPDSKRELMTVSRSQPPNFKRENVYADKPIPMKEIPSRLGLNEGARNYYWEVCWFEVKEDRIKISRGFYDYNELLDGEKSFGIRSYDEIDIPLNADVKTGLLRLLDLS